MLLLLLVQCSGHCHTPAHTCTCTFTKYVIHVHVLYTHTFTTSIHAYDVFDNTEAEYLTKCCSMYGSNYDHPFCNIAIYMYCTAAPPSPHSPCIPVAYSNSMPCTSLYSSHSTSNLYEAMSGPVLVSVPYTSNSSGSSPGGGGGKGTNVHVHTMEAVQILFS